MSRIPWPGRLLRGFAALLLTGLFEGPLGAGLWLKPQE
jgi:hypothetical protein